MTPMTPTRAAAQRLGLDVFYPIVPDVAWLERLVGLGVKTVQLRLKNASPAEIRRQINHGAGLCAAADCQLIVNDHWREAIEPPVNFIHLGQEDLATADLNAIKASGLKLGISTHSLDELAIALAAEPDYVALGPIYETKLKAMHWAPQGLDKIKVWKSRINCPLVAIAGITLERAQGVIAAGADSVAVITDFLTHPDPDRRIKDWLAWAKTMG